MSDRFTLSPADRRSPVWLAVQAHLTDQLATLRSRNDAEMTAEKTAFLRGQIAQVKALLALAIDRPQVDD